MTTEEFQKQVIDTQQKTSTQMEQVIKNYDQLDKSTKSAMEEFTTLKNKFADVEDMAKSMKKLGLALENERRMAFGNPVQRIAKSPELRAALRGWLVHQLQLGEYVNKDLDTGNTPGSTYIANAELETEIYDALLNYGAYATCNVRTVGAKTVDIRLKTARAAMAFVDEAAPIGADATKAGSKVNVVPKKIAGLISASRELLEDDSTGVIQDILNDFLASAGEKLDWITFTADGTGDSLDGGFTGMFFGGTAAVAAATHTTVAATTFDDWLKCLIAVNPVVLTRMAKWWMHPTQIARALSVKDGNGRPIFQSAIEAPSYGTLGTIFGYGVVPVGNAPSAEAVSAKIATFGDPDAMAVRIRKDLTFDRSEHWAFDTDEITFRATLRAAAKVRLATSLQVFTLAAA